jgi:hypothetical protein
MELDELQLIAESLNTEPPPPRPTLRTQASNLRKKEKLKLSGENPDQPLGLTFTGVPTQTTCELQLLGSLDSLTVLQNDRRVKHSTKMSIRPRISGKKAAPKSSKPRTRAPTGADDRPVSTRARSLIRYRDLITGLDTVDEIVKERCVEILETDIVSEPVSDIHTAVRILLQASVDLGRPYDTNMLAASFGISRNIVMQSLRKYYTNFLEQSKLQAADFVPTYLWIYGLEDDDDAKTKIIDAIEISRSAEPGCRSVFSVARDFVILYITEYLRESLDQIPIPSGVPECFSKMVSSFLYRARLTGRTVRVSKESPLFD